MFFTIPIVLCAYLLGSLCSAIIVCRLMGLPDPRTVGSDNPGTTNVKRIGGIKAAALTLFGDFLKSFVPVYAVIYFGFPVHIVGFVLLAVFIGHIFPIFFKFRGGKGWASALGGMFAIDPVLGLLVVLSWFLVLRVFHISAVSALTAGILAPVYSILIISARDYMVFLSLITVILFWTHRRNIKEICVK